MSSIVPAGVKSAEQDVARFEVGRRVGCWRRKSIRTQLLLAYVLLSLLAFGALVVISKFITDTAEDEVIANSREELMNQIINASKAALRESSLVLDARLDDGFSVLVAPTTFALFDVLGGESPRISPLPSYTEPDVTHLAQPTEFIPRYHCRDTEPLVGCSNDGLQKVSLVASSVYIVGSTLGGDGWDAPSMDMRGVDQTSILDAYIKAAYPVRESWVDSFVAGFGGGSPSPPLFRQYPGAVGNLSTDGSSAERRTYDPTTRGWYTSTTSAYGDTLPSRTLDEKLPPLPRVISPPYLDRFGRGYLISVTTPVIGPTNPRGAAAGVSGADILVSELQDVVTTIKSRETGEAFFLYRATGQVVASGQLEVSFTMTAIPTIDTLVLPGSVGSTFGQLSGWSGASSTFVSDASGSGSRRMTDPTGVAYELVWQDAWASAYVLLTCTREDEILVPIESQLASISRASAAVFAKSLAICAACLVVIVAASVVLSFLMARPVVQTLAQSDKIVANIGGDLFKGVKITGRRRDEKPSWKDGSSPLAGLVQLPGEVAALRGEFVKALFELGKKRVRTVAPASPLYQSGLPPSAPTIPTSNLPGPYAQCVGQIHQPEDAKRQSQALDLEMEAPVSQPLTLWNSIVAKITIYLLLPTVVAMVVVVAITFGTVFQDVESWMSPVRDTMVAEELLSLDVRAYERSQLASAFIGTAAGSLQALQTCAPFSRAPSQGPWRESTPTWLDSDYAYTLLTAHRRPLLTGASRLRDRARRRRAAARGGARTT